MFPTAPLTPVFIKKAISLLLILFIFLLTIFWAITSPSVQAGGTQNCADASWNASDETELNDAIGCFNGKTTSGAYSISLTTGISLTTSTAQISNSTAGVELLIEGNSFAVDGQDISGVRPFSIAADTTATIQNSTIMGGNSADFYGGGISNEGTLTIVNSTISNNSAGFYGGGISNDVGTLTIVNSTISNNSADLDGGGISNYIGTLTVNNSTISNNSADNGGGIFNSDFLTLSSTLIISNSTISGNSADLYGGGIRNSATLTMSNSTISGNSAVINGGGIFNSDSININNSIIANSLSGGNCSSPITSNGYNLDSDGTCNLTGTGDISNQDPLLGPLQDNGGPSTSSGQAPFTHALLSGSPAINAGDTLLTEDQRGTARPQGSADDIGAFELVQSSAVFLPLVMTPGYPDLVVNSVTVTGDNDVEIVISNNGSAAVTDEFWVELYIGLLDSSTPPTQVNDIWQNFSPQGAAWAITTAALPLEPGDSLTLHVNDAYFTALYSDMSGSIGNSTPLYVQVDSASITNTYGGVLESHEQDGGTYNNVFGPVTR